MNGQSLLHSALSLPVDSPERIYWVAALMRASRQLCKRRASERQGHKRELVYG